MTEIAKNYRDSQYIDLNAISIDCNEKIEGGDIVSECTIKFNKKNVFIKGSAHPSGKRMKIHLPDSAGVDISTSVYR